jgi:transposase
MSFLRIEKKKSGTYLRILESYRDDRGKTTHRILHNLGKVEDYTPEQLKNIGLKFYELGGGELRQILGDDLKEIGRYNYGYQQVYGKALKNYGLDQFFSRIQKKSRIQFSLRDVVFFLLLERLQEPCSKLKSFSHQMEYTNLPKVELHHIYRALDQLSKHNESIQQQIFSIGRDLFNNSLDVVFYDVTTFYFDSEVEKEGELRQLGYGKDGKIGKTQVLFSMMIDKEGNPVGYRIFKGDTYEGSTFERALDDLCKQYQINKVIVVADRGMLSKSNIEKTVEKGFQYIIGERLKSLPRDIQQLLLDKSSYKQEWIYFDNQDKKICVQYTMLTVGEKTIISTYSEKRAQKDKKDRLQKIEKAVKLLKNPSLLKSKPKRFYIKSNNDSFELDEDKIKKDEMFDGFIAISTNTIIGATEVLEQYKQLYRIEHSFRTLKSHLEIRPMFHWTDKRIEGHICLCYIAFALQNWVLKKVNKTKNILSEKSLRDILDKMQLSHIKNKENAFFITSTLQTNQMAMLNALGIKKLPAFIAEENLEF